MKESIQAFQKGKIIWTSVAFLKINTFAAVSLFIFERTHLEN